MPNEESRTPQSLDVAYVARLARLALSEDEAEKLQGQLDQVLEHVRQLSAIDVTGVEPTAHAFQVRAPLRVDAAAQGLTHEDAARNAPEMTDGLFLVPKIIE